MQPTAVQSPRVMQMEKPLHSAATRKTNFLNGESGSTVRKRRTTMKKQFIIKTTIGDIVVSATRGNVRKVAEAMLKEWTSRPVAYKIFPLGNKINKLKKENAKTLASLRQGDQIGLFPQYYIGSPQGNTIDKLIVWWHDAPLEEDGEGNLIYTGDSDLFYYTGKNHGRRRCDAHINQLKVWGNI